jgi:glycosyltransferase involved in cell wall biosynthesis
MNLHRMTEESVSVIMPVHNGVNFIARALGSVLSQSAYVTQVKQIVIVDDGSADNLEELLISINFMGTYVRQPRRGQGAALNAGMDYCTSTFVTFLDHDDEWTDHKTHWQLKYLQSSGKDIVYGSVTNVYHDASGKVFERRMGPARVLGASMMRASVFAEVGPFPEDSRIHEIIDWWSRASTVVSFAGIDEPALRRHVHGANQTLLPRHQEGSDLISRLRDHRRRSGG